MDQDTVKAIGDLIEATLATVAEHPIGTILLMLLMIWIVSALRSESREAKKAAKATRRRVEEEAKIVKAREKIEAARARTPGTPEYRSVFREALDRGPLPQNRSVPGAAEKRLHEAMAAVSAGIERLRRDTLTIREHQQRRREDVARTKYMIVNPINTQSAMTRFDDRQEATEEAQRQTKANPVEVWQLVARTKVPIPEGVKVEEIVEETADDEDEDSAR